MTMPPMSVDSPTGIPVTAASMRPITYGSMMLTMMYSVWTQRLEIHWQRVAPKRMVKTSPTVWIFRRR